VEKFCSSGFPIPANNFIVYMSSDEEEGDWRTMRRKLPARPPSSTTTETKPNVSKFSKKVDDGVVAILPGGLQFVKPSASKPRLIPPPDSGSTPSPPREDENPKERKIRRGEVGKDMSEVVKLESSGFVMTGSRNSRMNMLREIKEAETVTEDQRREELLEKIKAKSEKEDELIAGFRALLLKKTQQG